jgi:hypothetical protein
MEITKGAVIRLTILFVVLLIFGVWGWQIARLDSPEKAVAIAPLLEAIYKQGNYIEAGIWGVFAVGFGIAAFKETAKRRSHRLIAAITFLLFGLSDIVEVQTGAWWHPWWLFLWKIGCGISMVGLLVVYLKNR